jgi:hypothetical protein
MSAPPPPQRSSRQALVASLSVLLIVVVGVAAYSIVSRIKDHAEIASLNGQVASLTSQLEDSQKENAELKALGIRVRTMPVALRIDRDAVNAGYSLCVFNQAKSALSLHYMVKGNEVRGSKISRAMIDGGRFIIIPGLTLGDVVNINCEDFDDRSVTIK